jgi:hypothetical protein
MLCRLPPALCFALLAALWLEVEATSLQEPILASTLECHRRLYAYKVTKTDSAGRICWDMINVMSCWGRCDSNEVSLSSCLDKTQQFYHYFHYFQDIMLILLIGWLIVIRETP